MAKLIMTKGLPASGKTTWAKSIIALYKGRYKRVNKDDLRAMIDDGQWSHKNEDHILAIRNDIINHYLKEGYSVIVDDTNLAPIHYDALSAMAKNHNVEFEVVSFDASVDECIKRDLKRANSVGSKVIKQMYRQYVLPKTPRLRLIASAHKSPAIICDLDGTLAINNGRSPFDWKRVGDDLLNDSIAKIVRHHEEDGYIIILMSGRDEVCRPETEEWLKKHSIKYNFLHMRPQGNNDKDSIVKERLFHEHVNGYFNVEFVLDDRNQVVDMWRELGLTCLQVADGDF